MLQSGSVAPLTAKSLPALHRRLPTSFCRLALTGERKLQRLRLIVVFGLALTAGPAKAQPGRIQDGFYSGQSNGQSSGQSDGRVDGRANKKEGVPPSSGDTVKQAPPVGRAGPADAESMDAIVRPNAPR